MFLYTMSKKTITILYWIATVLIALFHIPGIFFMNSEMAIEWLKHVNIAEVIWLQQIVWYALPLAALTLLVPKIPNRIKERAYAWLTFVYIGAFWAHFSLWHPINEVIMPLVTLTILIVSYCMWHKLLVAKGETL